ncbi:HAMP domain-containing protein [Chloroflexota bacterium]
MKLQIKIPILVILILFVIGSIFSGVMVYYLRKTTTNQFYETAGTVAQAVQGCLELCMLSGDSHHVQYEIITIAEREMVNSIVLALPDGTISSSSDLSQIGKMMDTDRVQPAFQSGDSMIFAGNKESQNEFLTITPIINTSQCQSCHAQGTSVLGLIAVDLNTNQMDEHLREETLLIAALGGFTFLFLGAGLAIVLRKTILKPLFLLSESAQRLSRGEYSERVTNSKGDEIGMLAQSFNEMAESVEQRNRDLEKSHMELSSLNLGLEDKIGQRTKETSALNAVLTIINQSSDEKKMLRIILSSILDEAELDVGMIHMIDIKSNELVCICYQGLTAWFAAKLMKVKIGEHIQGKVFQSKEMIVVNDCNHDDVTEVIIGKKGNFRSCISLPIKSQGIVLGTLSLASCTSERFNTETVRLLKAISEAICIAVEKTRATYSLEEAKRILEQVLERLISAQEEERRRIARELHDAASQSLAAVALNLETIANDLPEKYHDTRERLALLKEQAIETMGSIRELALELRPAILDDLGLARAIKSYAKDYLGKRGIDINVNVNGSGQKLPAYSETMLFRIAQEALTNIVKHAEASQVNVELSFNASNAIMRVEDNGKGFDSKSLLNGANLRQSVGVYSMSERAMLLGGTFKIESEVGKGTFIYVEIPLASVKISHG